jgi:hypothetical protein
MAKLTQLNIASILAESRYKQLLSQYGTTTQNKWVGTASILGAEIAEGFHEYSQAQINEASLAQRQDEVEARAKLSIEGIEQKSKSVQAIQKTAFIKSGVKLEGSAINVITETALAASEAKKIRQREADYESRQLEVAKSLQALKSKYAGINTALSITGELISAGRSSKSKTKTKPKSLSEILKSSRISSLTMGVE